MYVACCGGVAPTHKRAVKHTSLSGSEVVPLTALVAGSHHLTYLNFRSNNIGAVGAAAFANLLASPRCALRTLNLEGCGLQVEGIKVLCAALARYVLFGLRRELADCS